MESKAPRPDATPSHPRASSMLQRTNLWWSELPGNVRGSFWIIAAGLFMMLMLMFIKILGTRLDITEILLFRQIIMMLVVVPTIAADFPAVLRSHNLKLQVTRIVVATVSMLSGFTAVVHLPLADATAIGFARSLFVTIFAIIFLKEIAGPRRWAATLIGFAGVLLMLRPGGDGAISLYGLMAVAGAAGAGLVMVIIRHLSKVDRPVTILTYQALFVGLIMLAPAIWYWKTPTLHEAGLILAMGLTAWAGQMCNIQAYRAGEATAVAVLDYTRLIFAVLLGGIVFAQWPGIQTLAGAGVIIAASLYTMHREHTLGKKRAAEIVKPDA